MTVNKSFHFYRRKYAILFSQTSEKKREDWPREKNKATGTWEPEGKQEIIDKQITGANFSAQKQDGGRRFQNQFSHLCNIQQVPASRFCHATNIKK